MWPNRVLCSALEEMRDHLKLLDENSIDKYKSLHAMMIEEVQVMANRMEAGLHDQRDLAKLTDQRSELRREVRLLKKKVKELKAIVGEGEESVDDKGTAQRVRAILEDLED